MTSITPFVFEGVTLRTVSDDRGESWFIAMDAAELLEYSDAEAMTRRLDDDEKQNLQIVGFGPRGVTVISESGLYSAILGSRKPEAKRVKKWVTGEVLPSIRKTGGYSVTMTQAEFVLAQAQVMVNMERQHAAMQQDITEVRSLVDNLAESRLWDHCPQNCEPISRIRARMNERYGLPKEIVDAVVWWLPLSPKPAGMVRNQREEAHGSQYAVYAVADITRVFARFVSECVPETPVFWSHRDIPKRFQMLPGGKVPKALRAHLAPEAVKP